MNLKRVILLILCLSVSVFAADPNYITDFGIYVYGDIQSIENAFVMVQAVAASSAMPWIIGLITAFYLPYTAYEYFQTGSGKTIFINLTFMTASVLFLDTTHFATTVHIEDLRTETNIAGLPAKTYAQVDGIPYPIAALASTVSTITDSIKTVYEDAIQVINVNNGLDIKGASYGSVGFGNALGDIIKIARLASFDTGDSNSTRFGRATTAYITQCVLDQAINQDPDLIKNVTNPPKDIFLAIDPTALNITGDSYKITFDSVQSSCEDFYKNEISDNYSDIANKLQARINKDLVGNTNNTDVINAYISEGADVNDSFISSELGKFQAYAMNAAALAPVLHAFRNASVNLTSGQDLANSITAGASLATLQNEGVGRFKWMMEILPMGFHYMLGVIYSISILIMIMATALGYQKGMMIWKNFAKGLMTFEFIKVSLVIITSTVNQYAASHAADFIASVGQNSMTIKSIPYTMHYMATMAGVAGMLGVAAIFMIPAMVFSGEVGMAAGALSSLASRYKGNDLETATSETAKQKAQNDAYERELQDQAMLNHMGISVPKGMGASQFYSEYQRGAQMANTGFAAMDMGTSKLAQAGHATKGQAMQNISAMSTLDSGTTMQDFVSAGVGQGMSMNKNIGSMSAYGRETTASNARLAGEFEGTMSAAKDNYIAKDENLAGDARTLGTDSSMQSLAKAEGLQKAKIFNSDGSIDTTSKDKITGAKESDLYKQGLVNNARIGANKTQGIGRLGELSEADMTDVQRVSEAGTLAEFEKGRVLKEKYGATLNSKNKGYRHVMHNNASMQEDKAIGSSNALDTGVITDKMIQQNTQYGVESSNIATNERLKKLGGINGALHIDAVDAGLKASTQKKVLDEQLKAGGDKDGLSGDGKAIVSAIEKLANTSGTMAGAKVRSDMRSIATAGGDAAFEKLQADSAAVKTAQSMKSIDAAKTAGFIDSNGNVTSKGMAAYGITPGEQASALGGKLKIGQSIGKSLEKLKDDQKKKQISLGKTDAEAEKYAEGIVAPFRDEQGNFLKGQAFWNKQAELKSGVFAASNSMLLGNGHMFAGAISDSGLTGKVSSGLSTSVNNQYDGKRGKKFDAGVEGEINKNIDGAAAAERARYAMNPKKWIEGIAAKTHDEGVKALEKLGLNKEDAEDIYTKAVAAGFGVGGSVAIAEVSSRIAGKGSFVGKVASSMYKKGDEDLGGKSSPKSVDSSNKVTDNPNDPHPDSKVNNKTQHDDSLNKDLPNSSTTEGANQGVKPNNNGKVPGLDGKGDIHEYNPNHKTSREAYLKHNEGAASKLHIPEPAPHIPEKTLAEEVLGGAGKVLGGAGKVLGVAGEVAVPALVGMDLATAVKDNRDGMPIQQNVVKTTSNILDDFTFGLGTTAVEAVKGDKNALQQLVNAPTDLISGVLSYAAAAVTTPFNDKTFDQNVESASSFFKFPDFNQHHQENEMPRIVPSRPTQNAITAAQNNQGMAQVSDAVNTQPNNQGMAQVMQVAQNTITAAQNDQGMAAAIDAVNTQQNVTALQNMRPGMPVTMHSRAGTMQIVQNKKSGNLDIHMNGQGFADHTGIPFSQVQNVIDSPQMQYEMAQMFAQSDLTPQNANKVLQAQDMETFKMEMQSNHQQAQMLTYRTNSGISQTVGMMEEVTDIIANDVSERFEDLGGAVEDLSTKVDRLN